MAVYNNTTTAILQPLYQSTSVNWRCQLQLRTGGFCGFKVLVSLLMAASAPGLGRIRWSSRQQMLSMLSQYHYHSHQTYIQSSSNRTLQLAWLMICQSRAINGADFAGGLALSARVGAPPTESVRSTSWSNVTWSPEP